MPASKPEEACEEFYPEVAAWNRAFALGAFAALDEPGEEGDVAREGDFLFTGWAE